MLFRFFFVEILVFSLLISAIKDFSVIRDESSQKRDNVILRKSMT